MEKGLSRKDALGHYEAVRDLKIYLKPKGPNATINNPEWYTVSQKGKLKTTPQRKALHKLIKKIFSMGINQTKVLLLGFCWRVLLGLVNLHC